MSERNGDYRVTYYDRLDDKSREKFNKALEISRGKTNNEVALSVAQAADSTVDDIVRTCSFEGELIVTSEGPKENKISSYARPLQVRSGKYQKRDHYRKNVTKDPIAVDDICKSMPNPIVSEKWQNIQYNSAYKSSFDREARRPLSETTLGRKLKKEFGDRLDDLLRQPLGRFIDGHFRTIHCGDEGERTCLFERETLSMLSKFPALFNRPEMSFLNLNEVNNLWGISRYLNAKDVQDFFATEQGKALKEHLKYDTESLTHMTGSDIEACRNIRNSRGTPSWKSDTLRTMSGETMDFVATRSAQYRGVSGKSSEYLYGDEWEEGSYEYKYRVSALYDDALYKVLEELGLGLVRTYTRYRGRWNSVHSTVTKKVLNLYQAYNKTVNKKVQEVSRQVAREGMVELFNSLSESKDWGLYMYIRDDRPLPDKVEEKPQKEAKTSQPQATTHRSKEPTVSTVEGLGELISY